MQTENATDHEETEETAVSRGHDYRWKSAPLGHAPFGNKTGHRVTYMQAEFARHYVMNGGNGSAAAKLAGYASDTMAVKCLTNASVIAEIKRLAVVNFEARLPEIIGRTLEIALNPETPKAMALEACFKLMDRAGMKPKTGPMVQINQQTNNTTAISSDAQSIIADVWKARSARMSGISATMTDKTEVDEGDLIEAAAELLALDDDGPRGGGDPQGPAPAARLIPLHSSEHIAELKGLSDADRD